ncbi:DNase I-like protein [Nemania sp. NC0429]|nr:DNase I-like protein [Nemania sp. NC0429]
MALTTTNTTATATATPYLDVFILTFNAGKQQIDPFVFGSHLRNAFAQNATSLPELVVLCLQEMAPLANGFIGSYMINSYFQSYATAVNVAARGDGATSGEAQDGSQVGGQAEHQDGQQSQDEAITSPYTLVTTRNVGMTGIMLLARDPSALHKLKSTEVSFGAGSMANKGALGLRMLFSKLDAEGRKRYTELTFVGAHLAAHEWNLKKRNKNWESLVSGLLFDNPEKLRGAKSAKPTAVPTSDDGHDNGNGDGDGDGSEGEALLLQDQHEQASHNITIYKPGSHLFVAGDLNYRISKTPPSTESDFPDLNPQSPSYFKRFLPLDQLALEKAAGRTLQGLRESTILFPPTYKIEVTDEREGPDGVPWKWAPHRWPGWCDRVLYLEIPPWASRPGPPDTAEVKMTTIAYDTLPPVRTSDHRAVFLRLGVPVLEPAVLAPSPEWRTPDSSDPRINLPYPVDLESWDHRARVKKWESVIGWSMLVSQSKQGIAVFVALFFIGLGTWWLKSR